MRNMERRKFEESWKEAFDQAEISPSENVWTNIELDLEKAKARKLKRRLVFYQLLAAASVIFALGIGLGVYISNSNNSGNNLALQQSNSPASADDLTTRSGNPASNDPSDKDQRNAGMQRSETNPGNSQQREEQNTSTESNVTEDPNGKANLNGKNSQAIAASTPSATPSEKSAIPALQRDERSQQKSPVDIQRSQTGIAQTQTKNADGSEQNASGVAAQRTSEIASKNVAAEQGRELIADSNTHRQSDQQNNGTADQNKNAAGLTSYTEKDNGKTALSPGNGVAALSVDAPAKEVVAVSGDQSNDKEETMGAFQPAFDRKLPPLVVERKPELVVAQKEAEADPVALMLARLERREQEVRDQNEKQEKQSEKDKHGGSEKLWTSVGFAAGSFNPVGTKTSSPVTLAASTFASSNATKEVKAKGSTYSVGVNMGKRLSGRWVLQGGVNYLTQASDYTQSGVMPNDPSNNSRFKLPSNFSGDAFLSSESDTKQAVVDTPPYNVNNSVRYLSVPMQAGYMVINRDLGLQLNAGISTDLLLQNTISATATVDGEAVDSDFEGSAYRQVNLSGLMGTEVSYRFGRRYRIALNPGMRYPFTNIYKSDDFRATRLSFDVGLRFRYIFN